MKQSRGSSAERIDAYRCPVHLYRVPVSQAHYAQIERIRTTSYLPDLNVWLALSWGTHPHSSAAWEWFRSLGDGEIFYCRFTQIGLLRLLTTKAVMGNDCLSIKQAWAVYDKWLFDPRVEFRSEPVETDTLLRQATAPFARQSSPKALGDCYLLAFSAASSTVLVTLDGALFDLANQGSHRSILLK